MWFKNTELRLVKDDSFYCKLSLGYNWELIEREIKSLR